MPFSLGLTSRSAAATRIVLGLAIGLVHGVACNADPEPGGLSPAGHCGSAGGDATCVANFSSRPYCSLCADVQQNQGCVSSPPVPACAPGGGFPIPPGGTGGSTVDDDGGTSTSGTTTGSADDLVDTTAVLLDDSSTGELVCAREGFDPDCEARDVATPYCLAGECVGCGDAGGDEFCGSAVGPDTPACDFEAGVCSGCGDAVRPVCGDATPVCAATGACEPCTDHLQCPGTACHISPNDPLAGSCFLPDEVRWVNNQAVCPGMGTEAQPSCSLLATLNGIPNGVSRVVKVVDTGVPFTQRIDANGDFTVAVLGVGGVPVLQGSPVAASGSLVIGGSALTYLHNLRFVDNTLSHGVVCTGAEIWIDDSELAGNAGWGMFDTGPCNLVMRRGTLHHNALGGIRVLGGTLDLVNATVAVNGNGSAGPGIELQFAAADILYSTIAGNNGVNSDSITCNQAEGVVRNSIVQGVNTFSISLDCFNFDFDNNALDNSNFAQGTNVLVPAYSAIQFVDAEDGDFRLEAPPLSPYGDIALWQEGDPAIDADGTPRPIDGTLGYAGIDEPG